MSNPAIFFDDWENKPFIVPVSNCTRMILNISTRSYNAVVDWGDGTYLNYNSSKNVDATVNSISSATKSYSPNFTGDIKVYLKGGLKDVYSISFSYDRFTSPPLNNQYNIQDLGLFLVQMPNLYSYKFYSYMGGNVSAQPTIIGDFAQSPDSVEMILIGPIDVKNRATALVLNFNNFKTTSKLKWLRKTRDVGWSVPNALRLIGDIAKIPPMCSYFNIEHPVSVLTETSAITYTSGKVWASSFDTLQIPLLLSISEIDNLLIDLDNSVTTKIGDGIFYFDSYRSDISDSAVASLQSKGFTVNVKKYSITPTKILDLDFQNNFTDTSSSSLTMIAGGSSNLPTFALSGRKPGEYCAVFNGSQSIKTTTNLPINSDKVTIAFWMKTTQTTTGIFVELSANYNSNNAFLAMVTNKAEIAHHASGGINYNYGNSSTNINTGNWTHVVMVIDRNLGSSQNKIYINGMLDYVQGAGTVDLVGNFVNNILFIGQRGGSTTGFIGSLTRLKIYNYPLAPSEVTSLYNS